MKGIILAGGSGTRLHPLTLGVSKQLLPIYDKPMIYYPLSVLMLAGIREVLIISTPEDISGFERLLGNGHDLGMEFSYKIQPSPDGLAQAFILGADFIGNDSVCLVLGDNIFYGAGLKQLLMNAVQTVDTENKAVIFGNYVHNAKRYGVVEFDEQNNVKSIEEKPEKPKSNFAVVGLYFYPNSVIEIAKKVQPSNRGELEITTVNQQYMEREQLKLQIMSRGFAWLDTGTHESLTEATEFVKAVEHRTGLKIACLEEIAYLMKFISKEQLRKLAGGTSKSSYQKYLQKISE